MIFWFVTDLSRVVLSEFTSDPVVEGYSTSATCSVQDGFPTDIHSATWTRDGNSVEGKCTAAVAASTITTIATSITTKV